MADALTQRRYGVALGLLLSLFLVRVFAQLVQYLHPVSWLPGLTSWQGSSLAYHYLLAIQSSIVLVCAWVTSRFFLTRARSTRRTGWVLLIIGVVYFTVMATRLLLGLTLLSDHHWTSSLLPSIFHMVLACFLLVVGQYYWKYGRVTDE